MRTYWLIVCALLSLCLSWSCSAGSPRVDQLNSGPASFKASSQGFTATVDEASLVDGAALESISLRVSESADETTVVVCAEGARNLKALYVDLDFDPDRYSPVEACPAAAAERGGEFLTMDICPRRGRMEYGQVLRGLRQRDGANGRIELAVFRFKHRRHEVESDRSVSTPPVQDAAQAEVMLEAFDTLVWHYTNPGDYNQDGLVGVSDLTPLGIYYGASAASANWNQARCADGNGDGLIAVTDITTIGQNYNAFVEGYHVYMSPTLPGITMGPLPAEDLIGTVTREEMYSTDSGPLWYEFPFIEMIENDYIWIAPYHGTDLGIFSNLTNGPMDTVAVLDVVDDTLEGRGHRVDPYLSYAQDSIGFTLTDGTDGDVTASADTVFMVWPETAGAFTPGTGELTFATDYTGLLYVSASYQGMSCFPYSLAISRQVGEKGVSNFRDSDLPVATVWAMPSFGESILDTTISGLFSYHPAQKEMTPSWLYYGHLSDETGWTLEKQLATGTHKFTLKVTDTAGNSAEDSTIVTVTEDLRDLSPISISATPKIGTAPLTVTFHVTVDDSKETFSRIELDCNGDGRLDYDASQSSFQHTYDTPGIYRAWVYAQSGDFMLKRRGIDINVLPHALTHQHPMVFVTATPSSGPAPLDATFMIEWWTEAMDGSAVTYAGDGAITWVSNSDKSPKIATIHYDEPGYYSEQFVVNDGTKSMMATAGVEVIANVTSPTVPTVTIMADPDIGPTPSSPEFVVEWDDTGGPPIIFVGVETARDGDKPGTMERIDDKAVDDGYSYIKTFTEPGIYTEKVTVINARLETVTDWAEVLITADSNAAPYLYASATPTSGMHPLNATITLEWADPDLDDTFMYKENTEGGWDPVLGSSPLDINVTLNTAGIHTFTYMVEDEFGLSDTETVTIRVGSPVTTEQLIEENVYEIGLAKDVENVPTVLFSQYDGEHTNTYELQANDNQGTTWGPKTEINAGAGFGVEMQKTVLEIFVAVMFDEHDQLLYLLYGDQAGGGSSFKRTSAISWNPATQLSGNENAGSNMSLAIINGTPAIAAFQWENASAEATEDLMYFYSTGAMDSLSWALTPIDTEGKPGEYIKLIQGPDQPMVAYTARPDTDYEIRFATGTDANGTGWNTPVVVDNDGGTKDFSNFVGLAMLNGKPLVAYCDNLSGDMYLVHADDAAGTTWPTPVADGTVQGYHPQLIALSETEIAVVYLSVDRMQLLLATGVLDTETGDITFETPLVMFDFTDTEDMRWVNFETCYNEGEVFPSVVVVDSSGNPDRLHYVTFEPPPAV